MNWKFWQVFSNGSARNRVGTGILIVVVTYLLITGFLGWWWDKESDLFDPIVVAQEHKGGTTPNLVDGYATTNAVVAMSEILLNKRGGYLSNDLFPPGVWMDNVPNWEFGVLLQVRDMARALRIDFSRSQSQSNEDPDLSEGEGKFFYDNSSWIFPTSEGQYQEGIDYLNSYLERLSRTDQPDAQFYTRADNLRNWLNGVSTRLGGLSHRLSESVGKRHLDLALAGEAHATQSTESPAELEVKTSWFKIDDVFYEARGQAWALFHLMSAIEHDFEAVLKDKNALVSLQQIIRDLEATQETLWSPVSLNGGGFGRLANHSLVMASYISRVNAAVIDLESLLAQG